VPFYNAEDYLALCLCSLVNQSYRDLDIVLVDDGSTDGSLCIARAFAQQDTRIRIIEQKNQGPAKARNKGMEIIHGEWLAFVDADDYIDLDFFERLSTQLGNAEIVQFGCLVEDLTHAILGKKHPRNKYRLAADWSRLYQTKFLEANHLRFPEGMFYEDVIFAIDIWAKRPHTQVLPYVGYHYVQHTGSITDVKPDTTMLFSELRKRRVSVRMWILISYTILRLKLHFIYDHN